MKGRNNLRLLIAHVIIPFATGAGLGAFLLVAVYCLDVGGMRTLVTASGGNIFDLGLMPISCAFGSLAISTNQAMEFLVNN